MYLDCTIKIPDSNGKITKKTIKGTTYIYYEYARIYLKDKKYNTPRRICIGKQIPGQLALMLPNDKFLKIFPQKSCRRRNRDTEVAAFVLGLIL